MFLLVLAEVFFFPFGLAQTPLDEGLVASYLYQGSAEDASLYNNDVEVQGVTLTKGYDGEAESACSLDGTGDYLVAPHSESLSLDTRATFGLWWKHEPQALKTSTTPFSRRATRNEAVIRATACG